MIQNEELCTSVGGKMVNITITSDTLKNNIQDIQLIINKVSEKMSDRYVLQMVDYKYLEQLSKQIKESLNKINYILHYEDNSNNQYGTIQITNRINK